MRFSAVTVLSAVSLLFTSGASLAFTNRPAEQSPTTTAPANPAFNADRTPKSATAGGSKIATPPVGTAPVKAAPKSDAR